jgi:type IV pilus assembly protein PilA
MYKLYFKTKNKLNNNGFTLVELLAVIVVLAIIMIIAIPTILDSLDNAKRKSFETYTNRILSLADQETLKREMDGNSFGEQCFVYNITKDFELNNTGDYK